MNFDLLTVENLCVSYPQGGLLSGKQQLKAVNEVSFTLNAGERLGIVGESGCGKSTLGRAVLTLGPPYEGSIRFHGEELSELKGEALRRARRNTGLVFQDTLGSFHPRKTVWESICASLRYQGIRERARREALASAALEAVGLEARFWNAVPRRLSGGQRQRAAIARAIAGGPELLVCDEAVSALDGESREQILSLLDRIGRERGMAMLFISHDLRAVRQLCGETAVMYLGCFAERGPTDALFEKPLHHYTRALLNAAPLPDPDAPRPAVLPGELPDLASPPEGCPFHPRCPMAAERCRTQAPDWRERENGHGAACFFAE